MRFPSIPNIVRTFYIVSNATVRLQNPINVIANAPRAFLSSSSSSSISSLNRTALRSMPTIPFLGALFGSSTPASEKMSYPDTRSKDEWRAVLNPEQFRILREKGTEAPFSGEYDKHYPSEGVYTCAGCNAPLYKADQKFKSGCGWPAFFDTVPGAVTRHTDRTFGMERTEIVCSNCGGHLGHVFKGEGYPTPTDERHCVNSVSIKFNKDDKVVDGNKSESGEAKLS